MVALASSLSSSSNMVGLQVNIRNDGLLATASVFADCLFDGFFEER
jgi:hypothetical protein